MKKVKTLLLILIMLCLTGCHYGTQLHERIIVQGVAIDKVNSEYVIALNIFDTESSSNEKSPSDDKTTNNKSENSSVIMNKGNSIQDAFTNVTNTTGKEPLYSQNLVLVIGEDIAKDGVESFIDFFIRHYEARPDVDIFIAHGKATEIVMGTLNNKPLTPKVLSQIAATSYLNMNLIKCDLIEFISRIQSPGKDAYAIALNKLDESQPEVKAEGLALFDNDKLTGFIDKETTKGANFILNKNAKEGCEVIDIDQIGKVTYNISTFKNNIHITTDTEFPVFNVSISVNANIYEIDHNLSSKLDKKAYYVMEEALNEKIKSITQNSICKIMIDYNSDIFAFCSRLVLANRALIKDKSYDEIKNILRQSQYNINVKSTIKKIGQEANPS